MTDMVRCRLNGKYDLILPSHRAARPEWRTGWERERIESIVETLDAIEARGYHPTVIDVGAEEGDMSAIFAQHAARMVLFEPNPRVWPNIRAIWEANDLPHPEYFVGFAGASTNLIPDRLDFDISDRDGWPNVAYGPLIGDHGFRHLAESQATTPTVTLDDFCTQHDVHPNLITIDVEGAEWEVLKGARQVIETDRPYLYVSVHPEFMFHNFGTYELDMHAYLGSLGYARRWLALDHEHHWVFWHEDMPRPLLTLGVVV